MGCINEKDKNEVLKHFDELYDFLPYLRNQEPEFTTSLLNKMYCIVNTYRPKEYGYSVNIGLFDEIHHPRVFKKPVFRPLLPREYLTESDIEAVIFNDPATIVKWADGTKTVVKHQPDDDYPYNEETGLALAIVKKVFGNKGNYNNIFKRLLAKGGR